VIYGFGGTAAATNATWTAASNAYQCNSMGRLYCLEQ